MTELGIRQVDAELVEAADAFGTSPARHPAARPAAAGPADHHGGHQPGHHARRCPWSSSPAWSAPAASAATVYRGHRPASTSASASRRGIAIVILAMYLDRMTGALGRQVSPLGRRALAKARVTAPAAAGLDYRPRPSVAVVGVVVLALVAGGMRMFGGNARPRRLRPTSARARRSTSATSPGTRASPPPSSGRSCWSSAASRSRPSSTTPAPLYTGLAAGQHRLPDRRLAPGHPRQYWAKYQDKLEDLGSWYGPTSLELARPLVRQGRDSLDGPQGQVRARFKGKIIGIEPERRRDGPDQGQGPAGLRPGRGLQGRRRLHARRCSPS